MRNDNEVLKARMEEIEKDLIFYLRYQHELSARSTNMAAVVEKEIKLLEEEIKKLAALL